MVGVFLGLAGMPLEIALEAVRVGRGSVINGAYTV